MKRFIDILVSSTLLVVLAPLFVILAIAIRIDSPGNPLFSQTRIGLGGRPFKIYKFRSMVQSAEKQGFQTAAGDARITKVGQFLRKSSLDEIPQLLNVLKGEMSLVGPRPFVPVQEKDFPADFWKKRHTVRPGITGLTQSKFRSTATYELIIEYDGYYVDHASTALDLKIAFMTLKILSGSTAT